MDSSKKSIGLLQTHLDKDTCPKTLRYKARANITPDQEFKTGISSICKKAEQSLVGAVVRSNHRRVKKFFKIRKLEQAKSHRQEITTGKRSSSRVDSAARTSNVNTDVNVNQLAEKLKSKIGEVHKLLLQLKTQAKDKDGESYPSASSDPLEVREKGTTNMNSTNAVKNRKRKERKWDKDSKRFLNNIESHKQHIKKSV